MNAGKVVLDKAGNLGIVTEPARKSGVWKGMVGVMWAGANYSVIEDPADLTPATFNRSNRTIHTEEGK